jgi:hypothetical protein
MLARMHLQRVVLAALGVVGIGAVFLPWNRTGLGMESGMLLDLDAGALLVVMFGIAVGTALSGPRAAPIQSGGKTLAVTIGAVTAAFGVWQIVRLHMENQELAELLADAERRRVRTSMDPTMTSVAFGLYVMIAAGLGLIATALAGRARSTPT